MSTIKRYSNQTEKLTPTGTNKPVNVTASSSIMTNYEPARSVDAEERIKPVQDINGNPILFSVGTTNHLYVVVRDPKKSSGWAQYDVSEAVDADAKVAAFDAYLVSDNTFVLAMALVKDDSVRFLITRPLSTDPKADFWPDFPAQLVERPNNLQLQNVASIKMGVSDDDILPTILVNASKDGKNYDRYRVNADTESSDHIWSRIPLPQNAHRNDGENPMIDSVIGKISDLGLSGTYSLYWVGSDVQLTFDSFPLGDDPGGQIISRELTCPDGAVALSSVIVDGDGNTDLYVAGDAIYRFAANEQGEHDKAKKITSPISGGADTELAVLADSEHVAIWFLDDGILHYVSGDRSESPTWSTPMPIAKDIGQIAALRNTLRMTNEIFSVSANNDLMYQYQDPNTTIWKKIPITLPDVGKAMPFQGYTTVIHFEDERDAPATPELKLSASSWVYATINGQNHILDVSSEVSLKPDVTGAVTIITKGTTASSPVISIASDQFEEIVDVNPQHVVNEGLKKFTKAKNLEGAKTQDGKDVIPKGSKLNADQLSGTLDTLTKAADAANDSTITLRTDANQAPTHKVVLAKLRTGKVRSIGMSGVGTNNPIVLTGAAAHALVSQDSYLQTRGLDDVAGVIDATFGNVWNAITDGLEEVGDWALLMVDDGLKFVVHLADGIATFILDTLEKISEALSWVLKQIEMGLMKLIEWIGQLFGWGDILTCQRIIANGVNKLLDWTTEESHQLQDQATNAFDEVANKLTGKSLPKDIGGLSLSGATNKEKSGGKEKSDESNGFDKSPAGGFAKYHISHSIQNGDEMSISQAVSQAIKDFIETIKNTGSNISGTVKAILKDILNGIHDDSMSLEDILKKILDDAILGTLTTINGIVQGMLNVIGDIIQVIKAILNKKIEIPFLSGFFRFITRGEDITLLNVFSLIAAAPTTVMIKLFASQSPFDQIPAGLVDKGISPQAYMNLLTSGHQGQSRSLEADSGVTAGSIYAMIGGGVALVIRAIDYGTDLGIAAAPPGSKSKMPQPLKVAKAVFQTIVAFMTFPIPKDGNSGFPYITRLLPWIYFLFPVTISILALALTSFPDFTLLDQLLGIISPIVFLIFAAANVFTNDFSGDSILGLLASIGFGVGTYCLIWATFFPTPKEKVATIAAGAICLFGVKLVVDAIGEAKLISEVT